MKVKAAVVHAVGEDWSVEEIRIDDPKAGEVLVNTAYSGLCHSDEHVLTGDLVPPPEAMEMFGIDNWFPVLGGHEGSGVVEAVGEGVTTVQTGDHVSCSFVPSCGRCHYCATGRTNLEIAQELVIAEGTARRHVANIYEKIGAANRVEAATYANQHGLLEDPN